MLAPWAPAAPCRRRIRRCIVRPFRRPRDGAIAGRQLQGRGQSPPQSNDAGPFAPFQGPACKIRTLMAEKKPKAAAKPRTRKRRTAAEAKSRGLSAAEMRADPPADVKSLMAQIERDGGNPLSSYREPLGGTGVVMAALPVDKVDPTPFQRDLSEAHVDRLTNVIDKIGRFLDPIIAVHEGDRYWTPNGHHRLAALRKLGSRCVTALVVP